MTHSRQSASYITGSMMPIIWDSFCHRLCSDNATNYAVQRTDCGQHSVFANLLFGILSSSPEVQLIVQCMAIFKWRLKLHFIVFILVPFYVDLTTYLYYQADPAYCRPDTRQFELNSLNWCVSTGILQRFTRSST